jgi:hypothetical protein
MSAVRCGESEQSSDQADDRSLRPITGERPAHGTARQSSLSLRVAAVVHVICRVCRTG